ncbi:MAG TPA: type II toxin-antitoxin system PemK/MazF family toxin [Burkholderiales bacterium]|nr:type II toxin-antitoxin system PemK/MazF family toxin [Burkholderiales bacterium]
MPNFRQGDVIKVPFPYTDRSTRQSRPALVVSAGGIEDAHGLLWVVMITSAANRGWLGDVPVSNLAVAGLPVPSVIRTAKIATIEAADATKLGRVSPALFRQVARRLAGELGLDAVPPSAGVNRLG